MIAKSELLQGRDTTYASDYTQQISANLDSLLIPMNQIRTMYGKPMVVNSGWRPPAVNAAIGGAPGSKHMEGLACDIADIDGFLWTWITARLDTMQELKVYFEDRRWTPTWVHFQLGSPKSLHRIFQPNTSAAPAPNNWNGIYDHKFDGDLPNQ